MKAKEMFEELNYDYYKYSDCVEVETKKPAYQFKYVFSEDKKVIINLIDGNDVVIEYDLFKAIQKQMEEL